MDAWIKGVRFLTVVYYNFVDAEVAEELLEAGCVLGMHIRIGIEVSSRFRGKYVRVIWEPQSYTDPKSFKAFLEEQPVRAFMKEGRLVSAYQQKYVFEALRAYNRTHRATLTGEYGLDLDELTTNRRSLLCRDGTAVTAPSGQVHQAACSPSSNRLRKPWPGNTKSASANGARSCRNA